MGLKDLFNLLNSPNGMKNINRRMLQGQDITTGKSNYSTNTNKRLSNLQRYEIQHPETSEAILQTIYDLEDRLHTATSKNEKNSIRTELAFLYSKYNQLLDEEKNNSTDKSIEDRY